jgi:hypothetical protein
MGRGPTRCYDRRCRYAPHIACSRGCRCPSHLVAHLRCHLRRLQAVSRGMFPLLHRIQRTLIIRHIRISCRVSFFNMKPTYPPPTTLAAQRGDSRWGRGTYVRAGGPTSRWQTWASNVPPSHLDLTKVPWQGATLPLHPALTIEAACHWQCARVSTSMWVRASASAGGWGGGSPGRSWCIVARMWKLPLATVTLVRMLPVEPALLRPPRGPLPVAARLALLSGQPRPRRVAGSAAG